MSDDSSVRSHYDELADSWSEHAEVPWRAQVLWPVLDDLLPAVDGARVLDVGCADGYYAARLADRGADVLGVDLSEEMVRAARERHGDRAEFRQGDATEGLEFVDDRSVDLVLCQHVLSHVPDLSPVAEEFARVLGPGGSVALSTHHPFSDYLVVREAEYPDTRRIDGLDARPAVRVESDSPTYSDTERFELHWSGTNDDGESVDVGGDGEAPAAFYRRPLDEVVRPLLDAGFALRGLREPRLSDRLDDELLDEDPDLLQRPPRSLCLRADLQE